MEKGEGEELEVPRHASAAVHVTATCLTPNNIFEYIYNIKKAVLDYGCGNIRKYVVKRVHKEG